MPRRACLYIGGMDGTGGGAPLRFLKMHGAGNDFVVIDARGRADPVTPALARAIGDRHRGVGFDQLVVLRDGADCASVTVDFWNADGSRAGACGNASRCVASLMMAEGQERPVMRTAGGLLQAWARADGLVAVDMGAPRTDWREVPLAREVDTAALPLPGAPVAVSMGNPHCVFFVEDAEAVDLEAEGPRRETDPLFPERTNVEVCTVLDRSTIRMRVWERGAGITLACGSGACAALVAAVRRGLADRAATLRLDGGDLEIEWRGTDGHVVMAGPVAIVFEGLLSESFLAGVSP